MTFAIRPMTKDDLEAVHEIELLSYTNTWSREALLQGLQNERYNKASVVVEESGSVAGYCFYGVMQGMESSIFNLAVHPDQRRKGVAGLLLQHVIAQSKAASSSRVYLEVRRSNAAARQLYQKYGFKHVSHRKQYYEDPVEDALIYVLDMDL